MAIPPGWSTTYIKGTFLDSLGAPKKGRIHFRPRANRLLVQGKVIIAETQTAILDNTGSFIVQIPVTNDPDVAPYNFSYEVREDFPGGAKYNIQVPISEVDLDIADLAPVAPNSGTNVPLTRLEYEFILGKIGVANGIAPLDENALVPEEFLPTPGESFIKGFYFPENFGAIGDGVTDDTGALQSTIDAASEAEGGIVILSKKYAWQGDLIQKMGVTVWGVQFSAFGAKNNGLVALNGTSRYRFGTMSGTGQHPYVGACGNLLVDGATVGGATELFRAEAVEGAVRDVMIIDGAGDGLAILGQNCSFDHVSVGGYPEGSSVRIGNKGNLNAVGSTWVPDQAAGGNKITNSYFHTAKRLFHITYRHDTPPDSNPVVLNFWPHDNLFKGCLFENYQDDVEVLGRISDGETRFEDCVMTGSAGMLTTTEDCVILVENQIRSFMPTNVTFSNCDIGAGNVAKSHVIRSKCYGSPNIVRFFGKISTNNKGTGFFFCDDRAPGGIGTIGGVFGAIDGVTATEESSGVLGAAVATNTLPVTSGLGLLGVGLEITIIDVETGSTIAAGRTITAKDAGAGTITIDGAPVTTTAGDFIIKPGVQLSTGINGGNGVLVPEFYMPHRYVMDSVQGRPLQFRRRGETQNRFTIDRDGALRWQNGQDAVTRASISLVGNALACNSDLALTAGFNRTYSNQVVNADMAISIDTVAVNTKVFQFIGAGNDVTGITITGALEGQELRIIMIGASGNTVTWPNPDVMTFRTTAPQPVDNVVTFIDFMFIGGIWREVSRSG